mmetsp:Transcript_5843/g.36227  ORF Transcript_5843/g.36227 Transcript_5843/m.36227 type:complete len:232 (+) Transcript_5843:790-1485(+)
MRIHRSLLWTRVERDPTTCSWIASHPVGCHVLCAVVQVRIGLSASIQARVHNTLHSALLRVPDLSEASCGGCLHLRWVLCTTGGAGFVDSLRIVVAVYRGFRLVLSFPCLPFRFPTVGSCVSRVLCPGVVLLVAAGFFFSFPRRGPVRNPRVPVPYLHLYAALQARESALGFVSFRSSAVRFAHVAVPSPTCMCFVSYWIVALLRPGMCSRGGRGPSHVMKLAIARGMTTS